MTYDVSDDELADARELEAATGELRHIAGGPGGWAAGTVMDEYDRMRAKLAEAQAEIARLTVERDRPYVKPGISGFVYQQPLTLDDIATALEKTLANHLGGEHGYYSPDRVGDGWLDTQIQTMAAALFDDGWTPPVVLPVAVERGQR